MSLIYYLIGMTDMSYNIKLYISWGERNTAVTQFLVTLQERQKTFPFYPILLYATGTYRIMIYKHKK